MTANTGASCMRPLPYRQSRSSHRERERERGLLELYDQLANPLFYTQKQHCKQHTHTHTRTLFFPSPIHSIKRAHVVRGPLPRHDRIIPSGVCRVCSRARERVLVCLRPTTSVSLSLSLCQWLFRHQVLLRPVGSRFLSLFWHPLDRQSTLLGARD